jgi:hypothetical protein
MNLVAEAANGREAIQQYHRHCPTKKWSGRWESNPNGTVLQSLYTWHFAKPAWLRAIGVRIFALRETT